MKLLTPATDGVPESEPVLAFKLKPEGCEPAMMLQPYGEVPPAAVMARE